jgi:hypothetical protein
LTSETQPAISPKTLDDQDDLDLYAEAHELLMAILEKDGHDPARADAILYAVDQAWRLEDRAVLYWWRQRKTSQWEEFRKKWAEHTRRGRVSFDAFDRLKSKIGPQAAASKAGELWDKFIKRHPRDLRLKADAMPMLVWETRIGEVLIKELEKQLGRPLRFSRYNEGAGPVGGPDLRLLGELFAVAKADRALPWELRARRARHLASAVPGSEKWFAHMIERLRVKAKSRR